jgi:hypothetical protein
LINNWSSLNLEEKDSFYKRKSQLESDLLKEIDNLDKDNFFFSSNSNMSYGSSDGLESFVKDLISKISKYNSLREDEIKYTQFQSELTKVMNSLDKLEIPLEKEKPVENEKEMSDSEDLNKMRVDPIPVSSPRLEIPLSAPNVNFPTNTFSAGASMKNGNLSDLNDEINNMLGKNTQTSHISQTSQRIPHSNFQTPGAQPTYNSYQTSAPQPISKTEKEVKDLDFLITIKTKSDNKAESWVLFTDLKKDPDSTIKIKLEDSHFEGCKIMTYFPPEYSKSINLGNSLLISGGQDQGKQIDSCYLLKVIPDRSYIGYRVSVSKFFSLTNKRERHNLLLLRDRNSVIVCGGFYTKSTEIIDLNSNSSWMPMPLMRNERTNATMMYFNNRYVYCIGGYEMVKENKGSNGIYLGSCETLDMNSPTQWNYINLDAIFSLNFGLCAMGCLEMSPNKFLLVGGFDGTKYLNEGHELVYENEKITSIKNVKLTGLGKGAIFYHTRFIPVAGNKFVNYDIGGKLFAYDSVKNIFSYKQNNL